MDVQTAAGRVRRDIATLGGSGVDVPAFSRAVTAVLGRAVPFDGSCLLTIDPATLLPTGEVVENGLPADVTPRLTEIELLEPDFNKFVTLARARQPAASLSAATAGKLDRSLRQRELRGPGGFADELRVSLSDDRGTCGALTLLREARRPHFVSSEVSLVASLAATMADGLRRSALLSGALVSDAPSAGPLLSDPLLSAPLGDAGDLNDVGLLILADDDTVELANKAADGWLDELEPRRGGHLPVAVHAAAGRARAADGTAGSARARVRTRAGRWVVVQGSLLGDGAAPRVAVSLELARPPELAPLIADAYGFTDRERRVTELVARGYSTNDIASELHLSPYTVQDHLKSVFEKSGTGSRGDLVARIFFDHYLPRLTTS